MQKTVILRQNGQSIQLKAEKVTIRCLNHQYTNIQGQQVITLDEPVANITITGETHKNDQAI